MGALLLLLRRRVRAAAALLRSLFNGDSAGWTEVDTSGSGVTFNAANTRLLFSGSDAWGDHRLYAAFDDATVFTV